MGGQETDGERKEERMKPKKRELHELPYFEIAKSGTIRLAGSTGLCVHSEHTVRADSCVFSVSS